MRRVKRSRALFIVILAVGGLAGRAAAFPAGVWDLLEITDAEGNLLLDADGSPAQILVPADPETKVSGRLEMSFPDPYVVWTAVYLAPAGAEVATTSVGLMWLDGFSYAVVSLASVGDSEMLCPPGIFCKEGPLIEETGAPQDLTALLFGSTGPYPFRVIFQSDLLVVPEPAEPASAVFLALVFTGVASRRRRRRDDRSRQELARS